MDVIKTTDLRIVKRNGLIFIGNSLCKSCGYRHICNDFREDSSSIHCEKYLPTLKFRILTGLDAPRFNTFRSPSWTRAARIGMRLSLVRPDGTEITQATVSRIELGDREEVEREHGADNHLCIGQPFSLEAFQALGRKIVGKRGYEQIKQLSVIYLERHDDSSEKTS